MEAERIAGRLGALRRTLRSSAALRGGSIVLLAGLGTALVSFLVDRTFRLSTEGRAIALCLYGLFLLWILWKRFLRPLKAPLPGALLADLVERRFPQLQDALRSAVDFANDPRVPDPAAGHGDIDVAMKREVIRQAAGALEGTAVESAVDMSRVAAVFGGGIAAVTLASVLAVIASGTCVTWFRRNVLLEGTEWPYRTTLEVEGFSRESPERGVPRGDRLQIRVHAHGEVPDRVRIRLLYERETRRLNLAREGESLFVHEHAEVTEPFEFSVEGGDYRSIVYRVGVLERPEVQDVRITLRYPGYTRKPAETLRGDVGELAVPEGTRVEIEALATKPLAEAWLEVEGGKAALRVSPDDPRHITGDYVPAGGGIVTLHLRDMEGVPPDRWFRFLVSPVKDRAPTVQARSVGIGSMITPMAMMPLKIRASDDYGVTALGVEHEIQVEGAEPRKGKTPFPPIEEGTSVEAEPVWDIEPLKVLPDQRLDMRVLAVDNDGIHGPKEGLAPTQSFLIVTPERLLEEFLRREEEQRRSLERAIVEERGIRDAVYRLVDEAWKVEGPLPETVVQAMVSMAKVQRQLARQMNGISQAMDLILDEMRNNRIAEVQETERLAATIIGPLRDLAEQSMPAAANRLGVVREMARGDDRVREGIALAADVEAILTLMDRILVSMKRIEGFTEVINRLRAIMKIHTESAAEAQELYRREVNKIFEDIPPDEGGPPGGPSGNEAPSREPSRDGTPEKVPETAPEAPPGNGSQNR